MFSRSDAILFKKIVIFLKVVKCCTNLNCCYSVTLVLSKESKNLF